MIVEPRARAAPAAPSAGSNLLDFGANQAAWWWCVLAAREGSELVALFGPLAYLVGRVLVTPERAATTLRLAAAGAALGAAGDQLLAWRGLLDFEPAGTRGVFMVALWAMFAASLEFSTGFVARLPAWQRALVGGLAGPLAYLGGERLGVLSMASGAWPFVALEWAVAVALLPAASGGRSPEQVAT
jgi:hypothetical protein